MSEPSTPDPEIKPSSHTFWRRLASALVLAPLVLWIVHFGGMAFNAVLAVVFYILVMEWTRMVQKRPFWVVLGVTYVALACLSLWWLRATPDGSGAGIVFWLLAVVWGADTGGYIFGHWLGGPKLAPTISPKKTWSGFVGGLLFSALGGGLVISIFFDDMAWQLIGFSVFISVISQLGDLVESSVKRRFDVKDSGDIIPGHGGLFDRVDGLVAAAIVTVITGWVVGIV